MQRHWILIGSVLGALAVGLGAFGAHGLGEFLAQRHAGNLELLQRRTDNWDTAAAYQMHHALAIVLVGVIGMFRRSKWIAGAGFCFLAGAILFSGSLYALVLLEIPVLGAITPLGGICFILGWLALATGSCCMSNELTQIGGQKHGSAGDPIGETGNPFQPPEQH